MKKVLKAQISSNQKHVTGGCTIKFDTAEKIQLESIVSILADGRDFNFEVRGISVRNGLLRITATEIGYWGAKIDRLKDFDVRNLIGVEVELVTDAEMVKTIRRSATLC